MGVEIVSSGRTEAAYPYHCPPRVRDDYLLLLTLDGTATVAEAGRSRDLGPGDWFLLRPEAEHTYRAVTPWSIAWVHFRGRLADALVETLDLLESEPLRFRQASGAARDILLRVVAPPKDARASSEVGRNARLLELLAVLHRNYDWGPSVEDPMRRAEAWLHESLAAPVRLEDIARVAHLSPFHFARLFKRRFGHPPMTYLRNLRMQRARNLMRDHPEARIADIARQVGFEDPLHFSRAFKRATGMAPKAYQRLLKQQEPR